MKPKYLLKFIKLSPILFLTFQIACAPQALRGKPGVITTFEEIPGGRHESSNDQKLMYDAMLDITKKINHEMPTDSKTSIVQIINNSNNDLMGDLIFEAAKNDGKDVVKSTSKKFAKETKMRMEFYIREVGIDESIKEIPQSQILVAQLNAAYCSPTGTIARLGILFTLLLEGSELGQIHREVEVAVTARLYDNIKNEMLWSKVFRAKKDSIL